MSGKLVTIARAIDDFIIDRALQPGINLAEWRLGIPGYLVAKVCVVLGAGIGVIWLHRFDPFPSVEFYQDMLCLGIMVVATYIQIRVHESREPKRAVFAPAARATGLLAHRLAAGPYRVSISMARGRAWGAGVQLHLDLPGRAALLDHLLPAPAPAGGAPGGRVCAGDGASALIWRSAHLVRESSVCG